MELGLENKVIIVSGGASGIGEGITRLLSKEKAIPIVLGKQENYNSKLIEEININGGKADYFTVELTDPDACITAISFVVEKYGRIDGLVNNAGVNDSIGLEDGCYEKFIEKMNENK